MAEENRQEQSVELAPIGKDGDYMLQAIEDGKMIAMLCGGDIFYVFDGGGEYQCCIHTIASDRAHRRGLEKSGENRETLKSMASAADQLFEVAYLPGMDPYGVMYAAEEAIMGVLRAIGRDPEHPEKASNQI